MNIIREFMKTGEESYGSVPRGRVLLPVGAVLLPRMVRLSGRLLPVLCLAWLFLCGCVREETFRGHRPGDRIDFGVSTGYDNAPGTKAPECGDGGKGQSESTGSSIAEEGAVGDDMAGNGADGRVVECPDADGEFVGDGFPVTRTVYSGQDFTIGSSGKWERIDWVDGDLFTVYCSAAQGTLKKADYTVVSHSASGERSLAEIAPAAGNGLQWGTGEHVFYAMYPSAGTPGVDDSKVSINGNVLKGTIPSVQAVALKPGTWTYLPDMRYAYMYAATTVPAAGAPGPVNLWFKPMVTALEFTVDSGDDPALTLYSFELASSSTALTGDFTATVTAATGEDAACSYVVPSRTEANSKISVDFGGAANPTVITKGQPITFTVFALPQDLTGLTVKFVTSKGDRTLALKVNGNSVTFPSCRKARIATLGVPGLYDFHLKFNLNTSVIQYPTEGGLRGLLVESYKIRRSDNEKIPVPWSAGYYADSLCTIPYDGADPAAKPDWLTVETGIFTPYDYDYFNVEFPRQRNVTMVGEPNAYTSALRARTETGSQHAPVDLSRLRIPYDSASPADASSTANCYVVTRPGWYSFPLVYGNALLEGAANPSAWTSGTIAEEHILQRFIRHDGQPIAGPWIAGDNGFTVDSAELVWQDWPSLVEEIAVVGNFIRFHIRQDNIHEGNAVIAAKDASGTVLWSWHIWVTAQTLTNIPMQNYWVEGGAPEGGQEWFSFLSENLGAVWGNEKLKFMERRVYIKISNGVLERIFLFLQLGSNPGNSTYSLPTAVTYQWGRKDPMNASAIQKYGYYRRAWYDKDGYIIGAWPYANWSNGTTSGDGTASGADSVIVNTIRHLNTWNHSYRQDNFYLNLWHNGISEGTVLSRVPSIARDVLFLKTVKTVYDPSPVGFVVPPSGAFSGMMTPTPLLKPNFAGYVEGEGFYFYTGLNFSGETTLFPAPRYGSSPNGYSHGNHSYMTLYASNRYFASPDQNFHLTPFSMRAISFSPEFSQAYIHMTYDQEGAQIRPVAE